MATFLALCQMVARESGTVDDGRQLLSVTGQGYERFRKIIAWTQEAWTALQNRRADWRWMQGEFQATLTPASPARYTAAGMGLSRWAEWRTSDMISGYLAAEGVANEARLVWMDWPDWRKRYDFGAQTTGRPIHYTVSPQGEICLGPVPSGSYVLRGEYRKAPQTLANDGDIPEMPERFHDIIGWGGLLLLAEHDEGEGLVQVAAAKRRYDDMLNDLERDQLPRIAFARTPLA